MRTLLEEIVRTIAVSEIVELPRFSRRSATSDYVWSTKSSMARRLREK